MLFALIAGLALSAIGLGVNFALQDNTNALNKASIDETNATNLKQVEETNATNAAIAAATNKANAEQAELAYQRSLPSNQVANMVAAGMSRNAAISALTGGGSYSAPVMQSLPANAGQVQPFQKAFNGINFDSLIEKISSLPANVMQSDLQKSQLQAANQQFELNIAEEKRKQQIHELDVWQRLYGKETATKLDAAATLISNALLDHGEDISHYSNYEDMVRKLGLNDSPILRDIPYLARTQLEDSVRQKFAENRAQQSQANSNVASHDAHLISEQTLKDMNNAALDWLKEKDAREKEYKLRAAKAQLETIATNEQLDIANYQHDLEFYKDDQGNEQMRISRKISERARRAWSRLADSIGIGVLKDLLSAVTLIGK